MLILVTALFFRDCQKSTFLRGRQRLHFIGCFQDEHEAELAKMATENDENDKENEENVSEEAARPMNLVERIYAENRKKATRTEAHVPPTLAPSAGIIVCFFNQKRPFLHFKMLVEK